MQEMVGGNNNRTPVVVRVPNNYNIVGDATKFDASKLF